MRHLHKATIFSRRGLCLHFMRRAIMMAVMHTATLETTMEKRRMKLALIRSSKVGVAAIAGIAAGACAATSVASTAGAGAHASAAGAIAPAPASAGTMAPALAGACRGDASVRIGGIGEESMLGVTAAGA